MGRKGSSRVPCENGFRALTEREREREREGLGLWAYCAITLALNPKHFERVLAIYKLQRRKGMSILRSKREGLILG